MSAAKIVHILHLDDDATEAALIRDQLATSDIPHKIEHVATRDTFLIALEKGPVDLILSDYNMPLFEGIEALKVIRLSHPQIPFIFVSGMIGEEKAAAALKMGASDYVLKDHLSRLPESIETALSEANQSAALAKAEQSRKLEGISLLANGIAHDLNNVFSPILMTIQLLKGKADLAKVQSMLGILEKSARRGSDMVRQLTGFATGISGENAPLQIRHLLLGVRKLIQSTSPSNIELQSTFPNDLWLVPGDAAQLHQSLLALCLNARKAMSEGGVLGISAENLKADENYLKSSPHPDAHVGAYVVITVRCPGTGAVGDIHQSPFPLEDPSHSLFGVMNVVKAHRGFVTLENKTGKGAIIKIFLPAIADAQLLEGGHITGELSQGHGELILIVDDEASVCEIMKMTLESCGYSVITAHDGAEAIATFAKNESSISLVLMDLAMPVLDGVTAIRVLQKMKPGVNIMAMTVVSAGSPSESLPALGIRQSLSKPFTAKILLAKVHEALTNPW